MTNVSAAARGTRFASRENMQELRRRAMQRALAIVGGKTELAARLGVSAYILELWLQGTAGIPAAAFYEAVDVIIDDDIARAAQDRREQPRPPSGEDASSPPKQKG